MPIAEWPLQNERPIIQVDLTIAVGGQPLTRSLLADTGAGSRKDPFDLILDEDDCLQCGGIPIRQVRLNGAIIGTFPVYLVDVRIPVLEFDDSVPAVGVPRVPQDFDGIACFRFLSRFVYGNYGDPGRFAIGPFE